MWYKKMSNEELQKCPYPNLIAELIESGYSICTLGTHMGLGDHCEQADYNIFCRCIWGHGYAHRNADG